MEVEKIRQDFYIRSNKAASQITFEGDLGIAQVWEGAAVFHLFNQVLPVEILYLIRAYPYYIIFPTKLTFSLINRRH